MRTWFVDHILGTDKRFSQWLTATEGAEAVARHLEAESAGAGLRRSA